MIRECTLCANELKSRTKLIPENVSTLDGRVAMHKTRDQFYFSCSGQLHWCVALHGGTMTKFAGKVNIYTN